jgi:3-carboxy-cis,cis-muconate cycloisomerase
MYELNGDACMASVLDSAIFQHMFGTQSMSDLFSDRSLVRKYLAVEGALARAQAKVGVVPVEAARVISDAASTIDVDEARLRADTEIVGYPILPLVRQLAAAAGEAGRYVHWGATTQDIMDCATVLQVREALELIDGEMIQLQHNLSALARAHRNTPMAGRTHLQQALPVTFGYKAAVWLSGIDRHRDRLAQLKPRVLVGSFGGAAGTLASLGESGLAVHDALCDELGLGRAPITWHVARDALAEAVAFLGLLTGSLAKIATDIMLMMSTEFGEVAEPFVEGRGASSTMPQKRNPISCELIVANARAVRQKVGLMLDAMASDFERATGPWHLEWMAIPESFSYAAGACRQANFMLAGLYVDTERMRKNLDMTSGLIVAEAVMMAAAPAIGRQRAHDVVYDACRVALDGGERLADVLARIPEVSDALGGAAGISRCCDPANYLGACGQMVDRVLGSRAHVNHGRTAA